MTPEDSALWLEWFSKVSDGSIGHKRIRRYVRSNSNKTTPCATKLEALLFGIPGSELWGEGNTHCLLVPNKLDVGEYDRDKLLEFVQGCEEHAKWIAQRGYPVAARISRERAEYYRTATA